MAEQKKKETRPTKPAEGGDDGGAGSAELSKKGKKIKEELDNLLDEIDDILEENAEEFVKSYVQRGGQNRGLVGTRIGAASCPSMNTRAWPAGPSSRSSCSVRRRSRASRARASA